MDRRLLYDAWDLKQEIMDFTRDKRHKEYERERAKGAYKIVENLLEELKRVEQENDNIKEALQTIADFINKE